MNARARRLLELAAVLLLALLAVLLVLDHQRDDAATMDEPYHVFAGAEYAVDGTYWLNLEHPPLLKLLAGASLASAGGVSPSGGRVAASSPHPRFLPWLYANRLGAHEVVAAARRPFPWFLGLLVVVTWLAGRSFFGPVAGLLAAAVVAFDPTGIAHAGVVHTDVGAALAMTATVALAAAAAGGRERLWPAAGLALGLALATKFTAVVLAPVVVVLPLLHAALERPPGTGRALLRALAGAAAAVAIAVAVLAGVYSVAMRKMPPALAERAASGFLASRGVSREAIERVAGVSRLSPPLGHYAAGVAGVVLFSETGRGLNYFRGEVSEAPFPLYFPAAYVLKSTPAFLLLVAGALALGGRRLLEYRALAFLFPAALLFAAAARSHFNIGVRHLLPVTPLLAVAAAGILAARLRPAPFRAAAAALASAALVSSLLARPLPFSYFNVLAGGRGPFWLSDSNVDWGQDAIRLARRLSRTGEAASTTVAAFGGIAFDHYLPGAKTLDVSRPDAPGRYAVSDFMAALGPWWLAASGDGEGAGPLAKCRGAGGGGGGGGGRGAGSITLWRLPEQAGSRAPELESPVRMEPAIGNSRQEAPVLPPSGGGRRP